MKIKNIIGLVLSILIIVLMVFLISQEENEVKESVEKIEKKEKNRVVSYKNEEEQKLDELKKQAGETTLQKVSNLYVIKCSSCHGKSGKGTKVAPSISGKSVDYILNKLNDYRNNRVKNSLMKGLLNNAKKEDLEILAKEISNFK